MQNKLTALDVWLNAEKFLLFFFAIYFFLWLFPFPFTVVPALNSLFSWYGKLWDMLVPLTAKAIFGINYPLQAGSDSTYNFVEVFLFAVIALCVAIIWSVVQRKRKLHGYLLYWLTVYTRYGLAFSLLGYATGKILKYQFPALGPYYYTMTYGQSSPMVLDWNYMVYTFSYNLFTGIIETLGALLLFFRRTSTIGALIVIGVMSNVVMMNFSYDVYVKIISSNLLLMAVFLIFPDLNQLYYFFILKRSASLQKTKPAFTKKWIRSAIIAVEVIIISGILFTKISGGMDLQKQYGDIAPKSPLAGAYKVETFVLNKDTIPPLTTDSLRWDILMVQGPGAAGIRTMTGSFKQYGLDFDEKRNIFNLRGWPDTLQRAFFSFKRADSLHISISGRLNNDSVFIAMKKMQFELEDHKIKLINDDHW